MSKILSSLINQECILKSQDDAWFEGALICLLQFKR